jgi:hypothetical protein
MPLTPRRTTAKLLRLHPEELARIAARARVGSQTPTRFIRETALGPIPNLSRMRRTNSSNSLVSRRVARVRRDRS